MRAISRRTFAVVLALGVAALAAPASAQNRPQRPRAGQMDPAAPAAVRGLAPLLGEWTGTGTMEMGGQRSNLTARWSCSAASGGHAVRCGLSLTGVPGMERYEETDLIGWNASDGLYHWYSVTNAGEVHDHAGSCEGAVTTFQHQGFADGKLFVERITFTTIDARTLRIQATTTVGNEVANTVQLTLVKG